MQIPRSSSSPTLGPLPEHPVQRSAGPTIQQREPDTRDPFLALPQHHQAQLTAPTKGFCSPPPPQANSSTSWCTLASPSAPPQSVSLYLPSHHPTLLAKYPTPVAQHPQDAAGFPGPASPVLPHIPSCSPAAATVAFPSSPWDLPSPFCHRVFAHLLPSVWTTFPSSH